MPCASATLGASQSPHQSARHPAAEACGAAEPHQESPAAPTARCTRLPDRLPERRGPRGLRTSASTNDGEPPPPTRGDRAGKPNGGAALQGVCCLVRPTTAGPSARMRSRIPSAPGRVGPRPPHGGPRAAHMLRAPPRTPAQTRRLALSNAPARPHAGDLATSRRAAGLVERTQQVHAPTVPDCARLTGRQSAICGQTSVA